MSCMTDGAWIVMKGRDEKEDMFLVFIDYKYNKKKLWCFSLLTEQAIHERAGLMK